MCSVNTDAVPAEVDETHSRMEPVVVLETLDLARSISPAENFCQFLKILREYKNDILQHTHTHTRLTALCPGLPRWAGPTKVKPIWILLEQEIMSGSGICWAICESAPPSRQITSPLSFLQAGCTSCHPTNSIKALKAQYLSALQSYIDNLSTEFANYNKCKWLLENC